MSWCLHVIVLDEYMYDVLLQIIVLFSFFLHTDFNALDMDMPRIILYKIVDDINL